MQASPVLSSFQTVRSSGNHFDDVTQSLLAMKTGGVATNQYPWCRQALVCTDRARQCIIDAVCIRSVQRQYDQHLTQTESFFSGSSVLQERRRTDLQQKPTAGQSPFLLDVPCSLKPVLLRARRHIRGTKKKWPGETACMEDKRVQCVVQGLQSEGQQSARGTGTEQSRSRE